MEQYSPTPIQPGGEFNVWRVDCFAELTAGRGISDDQAVQPVGFRTPNLSGLSEGFGPGVMFAVAGWEGMATVSGWDVKAETELA